MAFASESIFQREYLVISEITIITFYS